MNRGPGKLPSVLEGILKPAMPRDLFLGKIALLVLIFCLSVCQSVSGGFDDAHMGFI